MVGSDAPLALDRAQRDAVFSAREPRGSKLVGLPVRAIMLDDTDTDTDTDASAELPVGWTDVHDAVDHVSRELRAPLVKPAAGRRAGPDAGRAPRR